MILSLSPDSVSPYQSEIVAVCGGLIYLGSPPPFNTFTLCAGQGGTLGTAPLLQSNVAVSIAIVNQHAFIVDGQNIIDVGVQAGTAGYWVSDTGATALATVLGGTVSSIQILGGGGSYTAAPTVSFTGGGGTNAAANATLTSGTVSTITITNGGTGYVTAPEVLFSGGGMANGNPPLGCTLAVNWRNRLMLSGQQANPSVVYGSRAGDPYDFNYSAGDPAEAFADSPSAGGKISEAITALIPYTNDYFVISCAHSQFMYQGDPADNGTSVVISRDMGIVGKDAWAIEPEGNISFVATGGLFSVYPIFEIYRPPQNRSRGSYNQYFQTINPGVSNVSLQWDADLHYCYIFNTPANGGTAGTHLVFDARNGGLWPQQYPANVQPFCSYQYLSNNDPNNRTVLLGGFDGVVRFLGKDPFQAGDDDGTPINAYVILGPLTAFPGDSALTGLTLTMGEVSASEQPEPLATTNVFTGDGSTVNFTLDVAVANSYSTTAIVNGVNQAGEFSINNVGTVYYIAFNTAPLAQAPILVYYYDQPLSWNAVATVNSGPDAYSVTEGIPHSFYAVPIPLDRRQKTFRQRLRGKYFSINLSNNEDGQYFSFESAVLEFDEAGSSRARR